MKKSVILGIVSVVLAQEWFITNEEYGKMLYHNPRGISCAKCHGKNAKGKIIATYYITKKAKIKENGKTKIIKLKEKKVLKAPDITNITLQELKDRLLNYKYLSVMPKYNYLTDEEIKALYLYIHSKGKK